jgi:sortase A
MTLRVRFHSVRQRVLRLGADLLILAGAMGIATWLWAVGHGSIYQYAQGVHFASEVAGASTGGRPHSPSILEPTSNLRVGLLPRIAKMIPRDPLVFAKLEAPSIALSVLVREGIDDASLRKAAGHLPGSASPGFSGNFVVLGHRDTFFRPLRDIARNDEIKVTTTSGVFRYVVESIQVVTPDSPMAFEKSTSPIATFITCFPFSYTGPAPRRFIVRARLDSSGQLDE